MSDRFRVSSLLGPAARRAQGVVARDIEPGGIAGRLLPAGEDLRHDRRAIRALGGENGADPGIGLKLSAEPSFERYQPSAIAAVCSRSFRDALQRIARYKKLTCPEEIVERGRLLARLRRCQLVLSCLSRMGRHFARGMAHTASLCRAHNRGRPLIFNTSLAKKLTGTS